MWKTRTHILSRMVIFMILIASVPLIIAAFSIRTFNTLHQDDIDARQNDVIARVEKDLDKEFSLEPVADGAIFSAKGGSAFGGGLPDQDTTNLGGRLKRVIVENEIKRTGYIYITDDRGYLIAHSEREVTEPTDLSSTPLVGSLLFQKNIKTEGQKRYQSYWGEQVVGSGEIRQVASLNKNLGIFVELPSSEADAIFLELTLQFTLFTLLALILTGILSYYLTTKIVTPIKELERGTKRVVAEKFDEPVRVQTGDEIEDLGNAFNTMMAGLKELKELREEFVFVAAHELRTPVTAIKGFIELALEEISNKIDEKNKEYLMKSLAANERLIQLVNDLLEVAREEAGRLEIEVRPINIAEPIREILAELAPLAREKEVELNYLPAADLPLVLGDTRRVGEVMTNLVGNAIKYMGGSGRITVSHEIAAKDAALSEPRLGRGSAHSSLRSSASTTSGGKDGKLVTHIADTGIGIPKEDQKKLFEKFYRVYNTKTKEVTGTGLGLFIVKKIIEKMGGKIWVESPTSVCKTSASKEEPCGTTFSFELPIAK